jgi:hypothetical protein
MTATLGINDRVSESLGITLKLKIVSQASNFIKQILSFLAYGGTENTEPAQHAHDQEAAHQWCTEQPQYKNRKRGHHITPKVNMQRHALEYE